MPLQDLVGGECGGVDPFSRLTSHFVKDHGYRDELLPHAVHQYRGDAITSFSSEQLLQQFVDEERPHTRHAFHMDALLQEIREVERVAPVQGPGVLQLATEETSRQDLLWAAEFLHSPEPPAVETPQLDDKSEWLRDFAASCNSSRALHAGAEPWVEPPTLHEGRGLQLAARQVLDVVDDQQFQYSQFVKFMKDLGDGDVSIEAGQLVDRRTVDPDRDLERAWLDASTTNNTAANPEESDMLKSWEQAFKSFLPSVDSDYDSAGILGSVDHSWSQEFSKIVDPFTAYQFQPDNQMVGREDALLEGKKKLAAGDLASAVLCFEAAVQHDPDSSEAWLLLGTSQAENEQDCAAIPALKRCLDVEPGNLTALLTLATCYTNEGHHYMACHSLKTWLQKNPSYSSLVCEGSRAGDLSVPVALSTYLTRDVCKELQQLFMEAARLKPVGTIDPDVQSGLGVLFNLTSQYDKAADCFRAALQVRHDDFRLWNRLGATLANGNRSEEAVEAYHNALSLSPGFIRARYNLGISCINLAAYREAAEHMLMALNQQASGVDMNGSMPATRGMSSTIWTTLRLVVALLDRRDLYDAVDARDLAVLNMEFGI